jgi:hypothetical protein
MADSKITDLAVAPNPLPNDRPVLVETVVDMGAPDKNYQVGLHRLQRRRYGRGTDILRTDFGTATGEGQFTSANSGGTVNLSTIPMGGFGVVALSTGTTATGLARGMWPTSTVANNSILTFGWGVAIYEARVRLSALSDGTDTYRALVGFGESGSSDVDAIQFMHDGTTPNWRAMCMSNGTATYADTGVAVQAGVWTELRIVVNATATAVDFFVNSQAVPTTITTNIPSGEARATGVLHGILKSAGTNARLLYLDYMSVDLETPTGRPAS